MFTLYYSLRIGRFFSATGTCKKLQNVVSFTIFAISYKEVRYCRIKPTRYQFFFLFIGRPWYTLCPKKTFRSFSIVTFKKLSDFNNFLVWIFLRQLAIKWPFIFPLHPMSFSAPLGEIRTNEILLFYLMRYYYLINITHFVHISDFLAEILFIYPFFNCLQ